jgi:hypothetical protein
MAYAKDGGEHHGDGSGHHRVQDGVAVVVPEHRVRQDQLVRFSVESHREQVDLPALMKPSLENDLGHDVQERIHRQEHHQ